MRDQIILHVRSIQPSGTDSSDFNETFTSPTTVWTSIVTKDGVEVFDGSNVIGIATHLFYIRAIADQTFEDFLEFNSEYYRIIDVQDFEERGEFMVLRCALRGDKTKPVNQA